MKALLTITIVILFGINPVFSQTDTTYKYVENVETGKTSLLMMVWENESVVKRVYFGDGNNVLVEQNMLDGVLHGTEIYYRANGVVETYEFSHGVMHGPYRKYENGNLVKEIYVYSGWTVGTKEAYDKEDREYMLHLSYFRATK